MADRKKRARSAEERRVAEVVRAAIAFTLAWENKSLYDESMYDPACRVARAAKSLLRARAAARSAPKTGAPRG